MSSKVEEKLNIPPTSPTPLALPRWFDESMLSVLLPEMNADQQNAELDYLLETGAVEFISARGGERYRVLPRVRTALLQDWYTEYRRQFIGLSRNLARYCGEQVRAAGTDISRRDEWRVEQLYHLVIAEPERAMRLMKNWFDESVEERFDLNRAHRWLSPLEERRDWLAQLEPNRTPPEWASELYRLREYLAARAYWAEEWYKSITYLPREGLVQQLDQFFAPESPEWVLNLHAPGGHGKTATLEWLLTRYALPKGFICARLDFETLSNPEILELSEQPLQLLTRLAQNLNEQRSQKLAAFDRLNTLRGDPAGSFALVLREVYGDQPVVIFLDTLDVLLDVTPQAAPVLENLLTMIARIRQGDLSDGGTLQGYPNLRLVISARISLKEKYNTQLWQVFKPKRKGARLPVLEIKLENFSLEEATRYLEDTRKVGGRSKRLVEAILKKTAQQGEISPLQLALYADLVKQDPTLTPKIIEQAPEVDVAYLVNRIIRHIQDPAVHWLARYGVIFRRLDENAAGVLLALLEKAMAANQDLDNPQLPESFPSLETSFDWPIRGLLDQLTRYSWIDRQGEYIVFHPNVAHPQIALIKKQPKFFKTLQKAAFDYFAKLTELSADPFKKAGFIREAFYHALQTDQEGLIFWQKEFNHYKNGPGPVLWALVDEGWRGSRALTQKILTPTDYFQAQLALAAVLLAEKDRPFLPDQLKKAEEAIKKALSLAGDNDKFITNLLAAKIALANHKLSEALNLAYRTLAEAKTGGQRVEALRVASQAEAANSMWDKAIATLRSAYQALQEIQGNRHILIPLQLELVEKLLPGEQWPEAIRLLAEVRRILPGDPVVLEYSGTLALKQGRLQEARTFYRQAAQRSAGHAAEKIQNALQKIDLYEGATVIVTGDGYSETALLAAAARADWPSVETILRTQLGNAAENETLEIINLLLQFYLEVSGDWRQVKALLERGANLAAARPPTDSAVSRFNVMLQYMEFLSSRPPLELEAAKLECERRLRQAASLRTPELRVQARAYLLLVRFFGEVEPDGPASQIYAECAAQALNYALDLLLKLPPQDQVDIMRTIAALPGWSAAIFNEYALDPAERMPLQLLEQQLETPKKAGTFLTRLLARTGLAVDQKLQMLRRQIEESRSDWPVLYSSLARLLAAFGQVEAARQFLNQNELTRPRENLPIVTAYDWAYLADWPTGRVFLEDAIARLEMLPGLNGLVNEIMLSWVYLALLRDSQEPYSQSNLISLWLSRLFALQFLNPANRLFLQHFFLMNLLVEIRLKHISKAAYYLRQALNIAEGLGNLYTVAVLQKFSENVDEVVINPAENISLVLNIMQVNQASVLIALERAGRIVYERQTKFSNLKKLLPQGKNLPGLPNLDFWQKLLSRDANLNLTLEQIGATLLDEILPPNSRGRKALANLAASGELPKIQLNIQGREVEQIPWGILHDSALGWLVQKLWLVRNGLDFGAPLTGQAVAIKPLPSRSDPSHILKQVEILYRPRTDSFGKNPPSQLFSADIFERIQAKAAVGSPLQPSLPTLPSEIKLVHLIGDIRELPGDDLPYFSMGQTPRKVLREHLTPDALAHYLRQMGIGRTLLILEPLSTGATFEDGRVLLLRNLYASQLAQLGNWLVLAIGPRQQASELIARLVQSETITAAMLEKLIQQTRDALSPAENLAESQLTLFYPAL